MKIKKCPPPEALSIVVFDQDAEGDRRYTIQVNLSKHPGIGWKPMVKLGDDVIAIGNISTSIPDNKQFASSFHIDCKTSDEVKRWVAELKDLLKIADDKIAIEIDQN